MSATLCSISHVAGGAISEGACTLLVRTDGSPSLISSLRMRRISVLARYFHRPSTNVYSQPTLESYSCLRSQKGRQLGHHHVGMRGAAVQKQTDRHVHQILVLQNTQLGEQSRDLHVQTGNADQGKLDVQKGRWDLHHCVDSTLHVRWIHTGIEV